MDGNKTNNRKAMFQIHSFILKKISNNLSGDDASGTYFQFRLKVWQHSQGPSDQLLQLSLQLLWMWLIHALVIKKKSNFTTLSKSFFFSFYANPFLSIKVM